MRRYKGFTLSENVIVLGVLSIIIALVIPRIFGFQSRTTKQLALRRAVTNYQVVLMKVFSGATGVRNTAIYNNFLREDSYSNIVDRFDVKTSNCNANSCTFTTKSGIVWNVTTPSEALISLKESVIPTLALAQDENDITVFLVPFEVINGNFKFLISNDAELSAAVLKTRHFINGD